MKKTPKATRLPGLPPSPRRYRNIVDSELGPSDVLRWLDSVHDYLVNREAEEASLGEYERLRVQVEHLDIKWQGNVVMNPDGSMSEEKDDDALDRDRRRLLQLVMRAERLLQRYAEDTGSDATEGKLGRPDEVHYYPDHIICNKKRLSIIKNSKRARLCEQLFGGGVEIGDELLWDEVYQRVYGEMKKDDDDWRDVDGLVRRLNVAAARQGLLHPILMFSGGRDGVVRRIR
ncbi:hypothetical protein AUJ46_05275 [Candidatus Peregrinibacteria bacterium CG1_02_54_53]|nr:MAG: hypothetical protein AUJ46_05275 [Candidatus Peregrinibacteria bacterium CG1_02_54_53]